MRKFVLTAAALGALALAAIPATAAPVSTSTALIGVQLETDVATVQHWRWGSRRYRPRIFAPRRCIMVHTRSWSRWRCR